MNLDKIIERVPDYDHFLTVDELDQSTLQLEKEFPDVVTVFEAGKSRNGHPILCSKIGNGKKNALCFALPHPNEPIGAMTIEFLSRALAEDEEFRNSTEYTWYFMKCVDPDGTRLNEGWFKGPFNIYNYTKNFFRPGSIEQVEWTFPVNYKNLNFDDPMPETQAIMNVVQEAKPDFLYSLHNAGFGGAYWYITHEYEDIFDDLRDAAKKQGVALHLGEPETPAVKQYSQSIYNMLGIEEEYDFLEKYTNDAPEDLIKCGTSSASYAKKFNDCVTLLTELPYFFDDKIQDLSESKLTRREAIEKNVEIINHYHSKLDDLLSKISNQLSEDNPFPLLVEQMISNSKSSNQAKLEWANQEEFTRKATVSEEFDNLIVSKFYSGLMIALLQRAAEFEIERIKNENIEGSSLKNLEEVAEKAAEWVKENSEMLEEEMNYEVISIQKLVRIQIECGLIVANHHSNR
ncbi:MAG TPA: peptidase [Aliicoccus persicus]|uniref:Peptidase n=1 Tax=Aliicoccus persicus TaxID=930138 RepID=A0A921DYK4_9STAP|nr:peptidase [Aliicoccus persicus]